MASGSQSNSNDPIRNIVAAVMDNRAIIGRRHEDLLEYQLKSLTEDQVRELTQRRLDGVHEGKLTVFGHVCVTTESDPEVLQLSNESDPEVLSSVFYSEVMPRLLFRTAGVNFLEIFTIEDCEYKIPLLHLAAYCGNKAAVQVLLGEKGIDFTAEDDKHHRLLHMAVKGQDPEIVHLVLSKAHSADPESFTYFLNSEDDLRMTALQHAAWEGCDNIIAELRKYDDLEVSKSGDHGFSALHLASWNGHVEVVKLLLEMMGRDIDLKKPSTKSLHWMSGASSEWIEKHKARIGNSKAEKRESLAKQFHSQESHLKSFSYRRRRILDREEAKQREVSSLHEQCATDLLVEFDLNFAKIEGLTALHCAAYNGHATIVEILMEEISRGAQVKTTMDPLDKHGLTPLHHAVICGEPTTVEMLLSNSSVRGNVKDLRSNYLTPLNMAYRLMNVGVDSAPPGETQEWKRKKIIDLLLEQSDVKCYIDRLYKDRQLFVDAANAILVGGALIASITFAGWLQPPLNYQQYYGTDYLLGGAAPPDTYASYATVRQHVGVLIFWIFNSLSFFFAISTVLLGACVVLPMLGDKELERDVSRMRRVHIWTTLALNMSVLFVIGAFIAAGFAALPPTLKYQWSMIATTLLGGIVAFAALLYYSYRVYTLIRKIWGRRILQLRRNGLAKLKELVCWRTQQDNSAEGPTPPTQVLRSRVDVRQPNPPPGVTQLNNSVWEFYSPFGNVEVEVDIIFFHGLQGDDDYEIAYWKTWVAKDNNEVVWPKEWLSTKLPNARIFSVSYASSATALFPLVENLGEHLVSDIILDTRFDIGRRCPVILVGHCLGGIAIKQFLLSALGAVDQKDRCETFVDNVKGLFYYATPHLGSQIARVVSRQKDPSPMLRLMTTINHKKHEISQTFREFDEGKIPAYEIGEDLPTSYLGFKGIVVPEASARRDTDMYYSHSTADHFSVCKARDPNDPIVIRKLVLFINYSCNRTTGSLN